MQPLRSLHTRATALAHILRSLLLLATFLADAADADVPYHTDLDSYQDGVLGIQPNQTFYSAPDVVAPVYQINTFDGAKVDVSEQSAYMFMAGRMPGLGWGPSIVSSRDLSLVWADQHYDGMAQATNTYMFRGERVLAVFVDDAVRIISQEYRELYLVKPVGNFSNWLPDAHEAMLTDDDTVLLIVCPNWPVDLTPVGGPAEGRFVANCLVQEIDPETNALLFEWTTLDYFTVTDSVWDYHGEGVWDFAHMNSIQKTADGDFLISYRHLSAIVLVDGRTRAVKWVMGGKRNMFRDISPQKTRREDASAEFHWQHHPRVTGINRFTFFDNHRLDNGYCVSGVCSRGLEIEYDPVAKTVWLLDEWAQPQGLVSASRGSVQRTHAGNVLLAFGQNPGFVEYTPTGDLAMDFQRGQVLTLDHGIEEYVAYRVAKGAWQGRPPWGPNISAIPHEAGLSLYVSWNGATEVDRYVLLSSSRATDLDGADKVVAQSPRNGFETRFAVVGYTVGRYARIAALDVHGAILGSTPAVDTHTGALVQLDYSVTNVVAAGSTVLDANVPSSAAVVVPSGTHATQPPGSVPDANVPSSAAVVVPSSTHATQPPESVQHHLSTGQPVGIIVGSVVGGCLVLMGGVAVFVLWYRRRARAKSTKNTKQGTADAQQTAGDDAAQRLLENANEYGLDSFAVRNSTDSDESELYEDK